MRGREISMLKIESECPRLQQKTRREHGMPRQHACTTTCPPALVSGHSQGMFPAGAAASLRRNGSVGYRILEGPSWLLRSNIYEDYRTKQLRPLHQASWNDSQRLGHVEAALVHVIKRPVGTSFKSEGTGCWCPRAV